MKYLIIGFTSLLCLIGCGGGGSSSPVPVTSAPTPVQPEPTYTGVFVDSPVQGLNYRTETLSGTTNDKGEFSYKSDENIIFSIGGVELPAVKADAVITPLTLFATDDLNHTAVVNLLRLLQSLDLDGDATNGIEIPELIHTLAANVSIDFTSDMFTSLWQPLLAASGSINQNFVSVFDAVSHFQQSLIDLNLSGMSRCGSTHEKVGWSGTFQTFSHNVAGTATIINDCTIRISNFDYDGGGPVVYFYAANNHEYEAESAFSIGHQLNGRVYQMVEFDVTLPDGKTLDDFTGMSVWCIDFNANFGQVTFSQ